MSRYTADSRDRVRDAVDMVAVVSDRTELRRAGPDEYVGRCPFHDERTPSFGVDPHKKVYHCFGCQASGDVFTFVMETEGLSFAEALESLADRFGVTLETVEEDPQAAERRAPPRAPARAARPGSRLLRPVPVGRPRGRTGPGVPARAGPRARRSCGRSRSASRPARGTGSSWPPAGPGSPRRSCSPSGWLSALSASRASCLTASGAGSCSPRPTVAAGWSASGPGR